MALNNTFGVMDCKINVLIGELNTVKKELNELKEQVRLAENPLLEELTLKLKTQELNIMEQKLQYEIKLQDIILKKFQSRCWC